MRRSLIRSLLVTAAALATAVACGARDNGDFEFEFDPGVGGNSGAGATSGSSGRGGVGGRGGGFGRGGGVGRGGSFGDGGSLGVSGSFGDGGSLGVSGSFGDGGSLGVSGSFGSGGAFGTSGSGGSGATDAGAEDCTNGADDDGDGLLDCADSDCNAGFVCAPDAPDGWLGPGVLWQGLPTDTLPSCADYGYPNVAIGMRGPSADPAECASCLCGSPEGTVCPTARLSFSTSSSCTGQSSPLTIPANVCQGFLLGSVDARSVRWEASPPAGGACRPGTDGSSNIPPVSWLLRARACYGQAGGGGCTTGSCVARPTTPFSNEICIVQTGDVPCPSPFTTRRLFFQGGEDTRGCTGCTCSSPNGASCSGSVQLATDTTCGANRTTLSTIGQCAALTTDPTPPAPPYLQSRSAFYTEGVATGGACTASGGQATGGVRETGLSTFCCSQLSGSRPRFRLPPRPRPDAGAD